METETVRDFASDPKSWGTEEKDGRSEIGSHY
jgi:hypothetical protein